MGYALRVARYEVRVAGYAKKEHRAYRRIGKSECGRFTEKKIEGKGEAVATPSPLSH